MPDTITLTKTCPLCGKTHSMQFDRVAYNKGMKLRNAGALIQDAFPTFSADQREFILGGICDACWNMLK